MQEQKEKGSNGRRGLNSIANFFNNLTPNNSNKSKKKGFNNVVSNNSSESSSSSDMSNTELPPINSKSRLTVQNPSSRSTTPSYALDSRASSRNTAVSTSSKASKTSKGPSVSRQDIHLNITNKPNKSLANAGAGVSNSSPNSADRVIYPVRTKTSDQLR